MWTRLICLSIVLTLSSLDQIASQGHLDNSTTTVPPKNATSITQTGNTTSIPQTGNTTSIPHTGNTTSIPHTGNTTSIPHTGNTTSIPHTGNTTSMTHTGNTTNITHTVRNTSHINEFNGKRVTHGQFPGVVALRWESNGTFRCAGTVVSERWVLTAAHCVNFWANAPKGSVPLIITAGDNNLVPLYQAKVTSSIIGIIVHPGYKNTLNDLALVQIDPCYKFDGTLFAQTLNENDTLNGQICQISGWGNIEHQPEPNTVKPLFYTNLTYITSQECKKLVRHLPPHMICANEPHDNTSIICKGDSGSGLMCDGMLTGVVVSSSKCSSPAFFSEIRNYSTWIYKSMLKRQACAHHVEGTYLFFLINIFFLTIFVLFIVVLWVVRVSIPNPEPAAQ